MIGPLSLLVVALAGALLGALAALLEMGLRRSRLVPQRSGFFAFTAVFIALLSVETPMAWAVGLGVILLLGWHLGRWAIRELVGPPGPEPRRAIRNARWGHGH